MRIAVVIAATANFAAVGLLLVWAGRLLTTDDPDGGRHPMGAVMLVVAVVLGGLGLMSFPRLRRR
jgi:hypothetical protein